MLRPKRFAGIFGAAPAVALSALALVLTDQGAQDAATMSRSMIAGVVGFLVYSVVVALAVGHLNLPGWLLAGGAWLVWLAVSFAV